MNSQSLAEAIQETVGLAQARVLGVGDEQYSNGNEQKFESMNLDTLLAETEDELLDVLNYAVMLRIQIRRMRQDLKKATAA